MRTGIFAVAVMAFMTTPASAHISLETGEAGVGSTYKGVLQIPHGCSGAPTNIVRIKIPEGVIAVKPQPKPGWVLEKVRGAYAKSYNYLGSTISEGVTELVWNGGSLGDDEYDEFVFRASIAGDLKVGETIYFPVVQECPDGKVDRWIEIPAKGQDSHDLDFPAPGVKLIEENGGH